MSAFLPFTDEHRAPRETARKFVDNEIRPYYAQWERDGMVPKTLYRKAGALGLLLIGVAAAEHAVRLEVEYVEDRPLRQADFHVAEHTLQACGMRDESDGRTRFSRAMNCQAP